MPFAVTAIVPIYAQLLLTLEDVLAVATKVVFGLILVKASANQKQFWSAIPNQSYHCFADGEVVIHSANGHLVLITCLLPLS